MHRYRLSNHKVNEGLDQRSISGTTVFRNRWLYSDKPLFENPDLKPLVIVEEAKDKNEFMEQDKKKRETAEALKQEKKKKSIEEMTVEELIEVCSKKGFPPQETFGASREYLLSLLVLDTQVERIGDE